jgi:hypothetical protein
MTFISRLLDTIKQVPKNHFLMQHLNVTHLQTLQRVHLRIFETCLQLY